MVRLWLGLALLAFTLCQPPADGQLTKRWYRFKCANIEDVVCGTDGVTYQNTCLLRQANRELPFTNVRVYQEGACPQDKTVERCPDSCLGVVGDPICDKNGNEYDNICSLKHRRCGFERQEVYHLDNKRCLN